MVVVAQFLEQSLPKLVALGSNPSLYLIQRFFTDCYLEKKKIKEEAKNENKWQLWATNEILLSFKKYFTIPTYLALNWIVLNHTHR